METTVSVIIPAYNEEKTVANCLKSLFYQSYKPLEIIVVDDGSTDNTLEICKKHKVKILKQRHKGPGPARNLGAANVNDNILVFIDADMTFDKNFIADLVKPILKRKAIGTFSKNEFNANPHNIWSRNWNLNRVGTVEKLIPENSADTSPVFRAILKKEFNKVDGFTSKGEYTDDWSLSEKLGQKATLAKGAKYYHSNPDNFIDVWSQAQWFSTNKFISGSLLRKTKSLIFHSFPFSTIIGFFKSIKYNQPFFIIFKIIFDFAVWTALLRSLLSSKKFK